MFWGMVNADGTQCLILANREQAPVASAHSRWAARLVVDPWLGISFGFFVLLLLPTPQATLTTWGSLSSVKIPGAGPCAREGVISAPEGVDERKART